MKVDDKQIVREELHKIRQLHDGVLLAENVVEAAQTLDSPLHSYFEWDDVVAGHQHRLAQAYGLIRTLDVQWRTQEREQVEISSVWAPSLPEFTPQPNGEPGYRPTVEILRTESEPLLVSEWKRANGHLERFREYLMAAGQDESADLMRSAMDTVYATITGDGPRTQASVVANRQASPGAASRGSARQSAAGVRKSRKSQPTVS